MGRRSRFVGLWLAALVGLGLPLVADVVEASAATLPFQLYLPVPWGKTVSAGGPHDHSGQGTGTRNSVDLAGGTMAVVAAAGGTAEVHSEPGWPNCWVSIDHPGGWRTTYWHLINVPAINGQQVVPGQRLGDAGFPGQDTCGTGDIRHVHFSIWHDGLAVAIDSTSIGGYTVHAAPGNYCGYWTRDSDNVVVAQDTTPPCGVAPALVNNILNPAQRAGDHDVSGDGKADLVFVPFQSTGTGKTEAHVLNSATSYSTFYAQWPTALGYTDATSGLFLQGDVSGDGRADLVWVKFQNTGSGKTEAHVLDSATNYSTFYAQWITALDYVTPGTGTFTMGDVSGDGRADLVYVPYKNTGSGKTEAHVLDAATHYSTFYAQWPTALNYLDPTTSWITMGDVTGDGRADLVYVPYKNTGSGKTEAHVLDAATHYSTFYAQWPTALNYLDPTTSWITMGDVSGDGRADLVWVPYKNTASGKTEAHILNAATSYSTFYAQWPTALNYLDRATSTMAGAGGQNLFIPTATALTASPNPAQQGQPVVLNATAGSSSGPPAGTVDFFDGATLLGSSVTSNGVAQLTVPSFAAGSHALTATFTGLPVWAASTSAIYTETVTALPSLSIGDVSKLEKQAGSTKFKFTVTLSAPSASAVTFKFATANGTATKPDDYMKSLGTVTIPAGSTTAFITVLVNGDVLPEPDETFFVNLTSATGGTIADGQGVGHILNDD